MIIGSRLKYNVILQGNPLLLRNNWNVLYEWPYTINQSRLYTLVYTNRSSKPNEKLTNIQISQDLFEVNPCPAELFELYFSLSDAEIADAISSFKWQKIWLFLKNKHVWRLTQWLTEHLSQTMLWISVAFYFLWNLLEAGYMYTAPATQRLR